MELDANDLEYGWVTTHSGPWMEECKNCLGTGATSITAVYEDEALVICEPCEGRGYVEHSC